MDGDDCSIFDEIARVWFRVGPVFNGWYRLGVDLLLTWFRPGFDLVSDGFDFVLLVSSWYRTVSTSTQ